MCVGLLVLGNTLLGRIRSERRRKRTEEDEKGKEDREKRNGKIKGEKKNVNVKKRKGRERAQISVFIIFNFLP